jgi:hypothetical protein
VAASIKEKEESLKEEARLANERLKESAHEAADKL